MINLHYVNLEELIHVNIICCNAWEREMLLLEWMGDGRASDVWNLTDFQLRHPKMKHVGDGSDDRC